ncbi:hypothetical protein AX774_g1606 [Zancudomyces culisetae]|uniref:Uncharacterized protein n=1 Tax=Zancudomyces culisetae TaxID=1213189 RepID=A0A1R1PVB2_ZANCU|nr:hypothetical protein AX774_g1606 [Zancudomyces culisetae]|eukprot:OMH84873.1 hypothetical protein AX774_g1606 [Zancudomyces culisetae]
MKSNLLSKIVNYFQLGNPKSEQKDAKKTGGGENEREPISTGSKAEEQYECGEDIYTRRYSKDRKRIQMFVLNPRVFVFLNEYKGKAEKKKAKTGKKQNQAEFKDKEPSLHDEEIEIETRLLKFAKKATSVLVKVSKVIQLVFPWFEVVVGNLEVVLAHDADMWNLGKGVVLSVLFMRVRDSSSKESIKNQQLLRELTENIAKKAQEGIFKDFVVDGTSQDTETDRPVGGISNPKGNLSSGDSNARVESCVGEDQNFSKDTDAVKIKKDVESKGTHSELTLSIEGISLYTLTDKGKIKVRDHALKHEGFAGNLFHYLSREIGVISNEDKCVVLHTMDQTRLGINLLCSNHWWIKEVVSAVVFKSIRIYGDGIEKLLLEFGHCFVDNISTELNSKALRELLTSMNNEFLKEKDLDATNNRDFDKKNDVSFDLSSRGTENESLSKEDLSSEIFKLNKKNVYLCKIGKLLKRLELSNFCIQFIINEFSLITREGTERNLKKEASYEDVLNLTQRDISCSFSYKKLKEVITVKTEADGITVAPGSKGSTPANESKSKTLPKKCSTNDRSKSTIYTHHGGSGSTFTPAIKCLSEYEKDLKIGVQLDFFIETGPLTIYVMGQGEVSSENGTSGSPRLQNGFVNSGCKVGITLPIRIDTSSNEQLTSKPVISARIGDSSLAVDVHFVSACLNALNMCKGYLALLKNEMEFVSKMSHANLRNRFSYLYQNLYDEDVLAALASTTTQIPTNTTTTKESAIEKGQKERSYKKEAQRWITIKWAISSFFKKINLNVDVNKISAELTPTFTTLQLKDKELKPNFVKIVIPKAYSNAVFYLVNEGSNIKNISCLSFEGRVSGELSPVQISLNGKDCVDVKSNPAHINSRVIVGNNGIQYNGSINGKLGCNSFNSQLFKSAIESDFKINIGVLVASIFANELRFIMKWLPLWINGMNIVSKGNANGTMFNSTSRTSLSYEKAKGLNGRNSRANTASYSFFNDNKDIDIKGAEKTNRGMDFTLKIDTVLDEVRASVSASDCENPVIDQVEHGVNVCLRKANLVFRKEKKKLQSNTNLKVGFSQFLMNTFACTPRMNKNGGGEFSDFTEFAAKDVHFPEQILFLTQFSGSVSWKVKNNTKNDSTKRVGNFEADTFQIRISTDIVESAMRRDTWHGWGGVTIVYAFKSNTESHFSKRHVQDE